MQSSGFCLIFDRILADFFSHHPKNLRENLFGDAKNENGVIATQSYATAD